MSSYFLNASKRRQIRISIERWQQALRVLKSMSLHERKYCFKMEVWAKQTECGTIGCIGGHCSLDPWFQKRGLKGKFTKNGKFTLNGYNTGAPGASFCVSFENFFQDVFNGEMDILYDDSSWNEKVKQIEKHIVELENTLNSVQLKKAIKHIQKNYRIGKFDTITSTHLYELSKNGLPELIAEERKFIMANSDKIVIGNIPKYLQ